MSEPLTIRPATEADWPAILDALRAAVREGGSFALPPDADDDAIRAYWQREGCYSFVAECNGAVAGAAYLRTNQAGPGNHVANAGYVVAPGHGGRGIARALCLHTLDRARALGFRAMQFNFVVASNAAAVHLWQTLGFRIVGTLPGAFRHPTRGFVDVHVMFRALDAPEADGAQSAGR